MGIQWDPMGNLWGPNGNLWGPNGDSKTEKGHHGDPETQMGTHEGAVQAVSLTAFSQFVLDAFPYSKIDIKYVGGKAVHQNGEGS